MSFIRWTDRPSLCLWLPKRINCSIQTATLIDAPVRAEPESHTFRPHSDSLAHDRLLRQSAIGNKQTCSSPNSIRPLSGKGKQHVPFLRALRYISSHIGLARLDFSWRTALPYHSSTCQPLVNSKALCRSWWTDTTSTPYWDFGLLWLGSCCSRLRMGILIRWIQRGPRGP